MPQVSTTNKEETTMVATGVTTLHEAETTVFFIIPCKTTGTVNIIIGNEGAELSVEKG